MFFLDRVNYSVSPFRVSDNNNATRQPEPEPEPEPEPTR